MGPGTRSELEAAALLPVAGVLLRKTLKAKYTPLLVAAEAVALFLLDPEHGPERRRRLVGATRTYAGRLEVWVSRRT